MRDQNAIIELLAPAKINLFLQVLSRRKDGYHNLCTLMCCVGICDQIVLHFGTDVNRFVCTHPDVPGDETNLAFKAALFFNRALRAHTHVRPLNLSIHLTKTIPVGAGLGGGSSDAAAVLSGLNRFYGCPFDDRLLHKLALSLGADVPFFLYQKPSLAYGIGERLKPLPGLNPTNALLVYPGFGISTAEVFKNLNFGLTKCGKKPKYFPFKNGKFDAVRHLCNDLEPAVAKHYPVISEIKKELLKLGADGALMTGSGSTVFGLFADAIAMCKAKAVLDHRPDWQVLATELLVNPLDVPGRPRSFSDSR